MDGLNKSREETLYRETFVFTSLYVWGNSESSVNMTVLFFLRWGFVSISLNPELEGPPLVGCPRLLIQYIRSCVPYWRPFLHPQPEDAPGTRQVPGCCECRNEPSGFIKFRKFLTRWGTVSYSRITVPNGVITCGHQRMVYGKGLPLVDTGNVMWTARLCKNTCHLSVFHLLSLNVTHIKGIYNGFKVVLRYLGSCV